MELRCHHVVARDDGSKALAVIRARDDVVAIDHAIRM